MRRLITTLVVALAVLAATCGKALADPVQSSTQGSSTDQTATAASSATQIQPSNQNISVRVLSPGSDGTVSQSNTATSNADATNTATTTQSSSQTAGGCGCAVPTVTSGSIGDVLGTAMQAADPATTPATPAPAASQQSNDAAPTGAATNTAPTTQTQTQAAPSGGSGVQSATQGSSTDQTAVAASSAKQVDPSNSNISVRVLSPGSDGNVTQSNDATSHADATNSATTTQSSSQSGGGGGVQSSNQDADTTQGALGLSSATQDHPSNSNVSVRVLSPGNAGSVSQSNTADSSAHATNTAPVSQSATQTQSGSPCGCSGSGSAVQSGIQKSDVDQGAIAASSATQIHPSNSSQSIRIGSWGNDGNVTQSNDATSTADATNTAPVTQTATQDPSGPVTLTPSCGCASSSPDVQAIGQQSDVGQLGVAASSAKQVGASNSSDPVRIWSPGNGGDVTQSNDATSTADATNTATPTQTGTQTQSGSGVQAIGQESRVGQGAIALSSALQAPGESRCGCGGSSFGNTADPVRIGSFGNDGSVTQSNDATSTADATNTATPTQSGTQSQSGSSCGCSSGPAVQAVGQESKVGQFGLAPSSADQIGASNSADPVRVWSPGGDGSVSQSNDATSTANATNTATPTQTGTQTQSGSSCGCSGPAVQAIGQESKVGQLSAGLSSARQIGASNTADPIRVWSLGGGGSVTQSNDATSTADATNTATPTQTGTQTQSGPGVQAIGQESKVGQAAIALSSALQAPGESRCGCDGSSFGNTADPVRIGSWGNDGSVDQSNDATSTADATNTATPTHTGTQTQAGSKCGCGGLDVQALGQYSNVEQLAVGLSSALQIGADNSSNPIRIKSFGGDGSTSQSNDATSEGNGSNVAKTLQPGQQMLL